MKKMAATNQPMPEPPDGGTRVVRIVEMSDIPTEVQQVRVEGLVRTKVDIVGEQVKGVALATDLQDAFERVHRAVDNLKQLNVFKDAIEVSLTKAKVGGSSLGKSYVDVVFKVKEKKCFHASIVAHAGNQAGDASVSFALRNPLGRAEELKVTTSTEFPRWGQILQVEFNKPFIRDLRKRLLLSMGTAKLDHPFSGYQQTTTGTSAQLLFPSFLGEHNLGWSLDWRETFGFFNTAPMSVRGHGGHTLKSSIKHVLTLDTRDCVWNPHSGSTAKIVQEVAGLGGNVCFGKMEVQTEVYQKIFSEFVASCSLWGGMMRSFGSAPSHISDRLFLGGPTTLRGFGMWGLGPREKDFSLGGHLYWASALHLYSPIPILSWVSGQRLKLHSFLTGGNLTATDVKRLGDLQELVRSVRLSVGTGISMRIGPAKVELNYVWPLWAESTDKLMTGFQIGVGLEML